MKISKIIKKIFMRNRKISNPNTLEKPMGEIRNLSMEECEKLEKIIKLKVEVNKYFLDNRQKLGEKILNKYNTKNPYILCKETILDFEKKIDLFEKNSNIHMVCKAGCDACCYQLIGLNPAEKEIVRKAVYKLTTGERERIKERAKRVLDILEKENFNVIYGTSVQRDYTEAQLNKYLQLNLRCPLLSESHKCMIYETRPMACWTYRNYGCREECIDKISQFSVAFETAGYPLIDALATINYSKYDMNDYKILPCYLYEIL